MKKLISPLSIGLIIIIIGEMLDLDAKTDFILKSAMLGIIGISYFLAGFNEKKNLNKMIFMICGIFLLLKNFIGQNGLLTFLSIICVIIPIYLKYQSEKNIEKVLENNNN